MSSPSSRPPARPLACRMLLTRDASTAALRFVCLSCRSKIDQRYAIPMRGGNIGSGSFCDTRCALVWIAEHAPELGKERAERMARSVDESLQEGCTTQPASCMQTVAQHVAARKRKRPAEDESPPEQAPLVGGEGDSVVHCLRVKRPGGGWCGELTPGGDTLSATMAKQGKWQMNKVMPARVNGNTVSFWPCLAVDPAHVAGDPNEATLSLFVRRKSPEVHYVPR
jgi:hypothetical protein